MAGYFTSPDLVMLMPWTYKYLIEQKGMNLNDSERVFNRVTVYACAPRTGGCDGILISHRVRSHCVNGLTECLISII